jgi:hypothetical protein
VAVGVTEDNDVAGRMGYDLEAGFRMEPDDEVLHSVTNERVGHSRP